MATPEEIIEDSLDTPLEVEADGDKRRVKNRSLDELIKADEYLDKKKAQAKKFGGLQTFTVVHQRVGHRDA